MGNLENLPLYEMVAIFIAAIIGRGVMKIENRIVVTLVIAVLFHLINFALFWYWSKKEEDCEQEEPMNTAVEKETSTNSEWEKKSRNFLIVESILWIILLVLVSMPDSLVSKYINDVATYEFISEMYELAVMGFSMFYWLKLYFASDGHEQEISTKEMMLYFYTLPIIYSSWFDVYTINNFIVHR